jgi:hypothetical protein
MPANWAPSGLTSTRGPALLVPGWAVVEPALVPRVWLSDTEPLPWVERRFPSIFTVLQEQLGLKLEPVRAPVQVLVVDHVQRPTSD